MNESPPRSIDPFRHLNPQLWIDSKKAHITLFSIGSLLTLPAVYTLFMMVLLLTKGFGFGPADIDAEAFIGIVSVAGSISTGTLAWSALGFLFFKRADARWQRWSWNTCTVYGYIGTLSYVGWLIFFVQESGIDFNNSWGEIISSALYLLITLSAVACIIFGRRYAGAAKEFLQASKSGDQSPQAPIDPD